MNPALQLLELFLKVFSELLLQLLQPPFLLFRAPPLRHRSGRHRLLRRLRHFLPLPRFQLLFLLFEVLLEIFLKLLLDLLLKLLTVLIPAL
jgi:hypothetical protein